jgi:hypothetical protein
MNRRDIVRHGGVYSQEFLQGFWNMDYSFMTSLSLKDVLENPAPREYDLFLMYCMADI